jgi:hypothetical protein
MLKRAFGISLLHTCLGEGCAGLEGRVAPGKPTLRKRQIFRACTDGKRNVQAGAAWVTVLAKSRYFGNLRRESKRNLRGGLTAVFRGRHLYRYVSILTETEHKGPVSPEGGQKTRRQKHHENGFVFSHVGSFSNWSKYSY